MARKEPIKLLVDESIAGVRSPAFVSGRKKAFQATLTSSVGNATAVVKIQVSNDKVNWLDAMTIELLATNVLPHTDGDQLGLITNWTYYSAYISEMSGTSASLTVIAGD